MATKKKKKKNTGKKDEKEETHLTEKAGEPKATWCSSEPGLELELVLIVLEN